MSSQLRLKVLKQQLLCHSPRCSYSTAQVDTLSRAASVLEIIAKTDEKTRLPEVSTSEFMQLYNSLEAEAERRSLLLSLALNYSNRQFLQDFSKISSLLEAESTNTYHIQQRAKEMLHQPYEKIFRIIGSVNGGVKFLVDLRKDLLKVCRELPQGEDLNALQSMGRNLKEVIPCAARKSACNYQVILVKFCSCSRCGLVLGS